MNCCGCMKMRLEQFNNEKYIMYTYIYSIYNITFRFGIHNPVVSRCVLVRRYAAECRAMHY